MKNIVLFCMLVSIQYSCAMLEPEVFEMNPDLQVPHGWPEISRMTLDGGECPMISGRYMEPPKIYPAERSSSLAPNPNWFLYLTFMPFYKLDEQVMPREETSLAEGQFEILQSDRDQFDFWIVDARSELSRYTFKQTEGDFECRDGYIFFPLLTRYGADQQGGFNSQRQHILAVDSDGNLVLSRIFGPYKKTLLHHKPSFEYEFLQYSRVSSE